MYLLKKIIKKIIRTNKVLVAHTASVIGLKPGISFISFASAIDLCDGLVKILPRDIDIIVGIPRSGLFVANILALKLAKPLTTPDRIDLIWQSKHIPSELSTNKRYLLVDDSYRTGGTMNEVIELMLGQGIKRENILTASLIVGLEGKFNVDFYSVVIEGPRFFEWNMLHKKMNLITDMDGVLCEEPPAEVRNNENAYIKWLNKARPFLIPTFEIETILTSRIEKYRIETELWLKEYNVKYKKLVMSDAGSREEQRQRGLIHKIVTLKQMKPSMYWESSYKEALLIKEKVDVPILCIDKKIIL